MPEPVVTPAARKLRQTGIKKRKELGGKRLGVLVGSGSSVKPGNPS